MTLHQFQAMTVLHCFLVYLPVVFLGFELRGFEFEVPVGLEGLLLETFGLWGFALEVTSGLDGGGLWGLALEVPVGLVGFSAEGLGGGGYSVSGSVISTELAIPGNRLSFSFPVLRLRPLVVTSS